MRALAIPRMVRFDIDFSRYRRGDGENVNAMASSRCVLNQGIDIFTLKSTFRTFGRHDAMGGFWSAT